MTREDVMTLETVLCEGTMSMETVSRMQSMLYGLDSPVGSTQIRLMSLLACLDEAEDELTEMGGDQDDERVSHLWHRMRMGIDSLNDAMDRERFRATTLEALRAMSNGFGMDLGGEA